MRTNGTLGLAHLLFDRRRNVVQKRFVGGASFFQLGGDFPVVVRVQIAESQIFEFAAQFTHTQPMRNRRVNVHRLLRDALPLFRTEVFQRPHVVQSIGKLHQYDAHVINHCQQHLADILGLLFFA